MINPAYKVTFGVEFEAILAFHESLLQHHLSTTATTTTTTTEVDRPKIIKDIPDDTRRAMCQTQQEYMMTRPAYMGWGLTTPTTYPSGKAGFNFQEFFDNQIKKFGYRGYGGEVLHIAKLILPDGVAIHDSIASKYEDFGSWHVTQDRSLVGVDKETLAHEFERAKRDVGKEEIEDWDTHGVELVSRVLPYQPSSFAEINTHLTSLRGGPESKHMASTTDHCGLHVHIGLPPPKDLLPGTPPPSFTLPTLQHLAYLLVIYEKAISQLHPSYRREGSVASMVDLQTNLDNYIDEPTFDFDIDFDLNLDDKWDSNWDTSLPTATSPPPPTSSDTPSISFAKTRAKIFSKNMTVEKLATLMGGKTKGRIVNWLYAARTNGSARTLEFRQHQGTLDLEAVRWWVSFCVGLVRLAELRGREVGVGKDGEVFGGEGYRYTERSEEISFWDLLEEMEIEEEGRVWFQRKAGGGLQG